MKPKRSKNMKNAGFAEGWIDTDDLVKPGEIKEIFPGVYVNNTGKVLDPPEPIKKPGKTRSPKSKK
jgi:hypothetical protein